MVDFAALRSRMSDPVFKEEQRKKREAEELALEQRDRRHRAYRDVLEHRYDDLAEKERSFFYSVRRTLGSGLSLSEPQEKWLKDIAVRFEPKLADYDGATEIQSPLGDGKL
jgi:hypothetical protein